MFYLMNKINILNSWFICPCLISLFLFISIFLYIVFTSFSDIKFKLFIEVAVTAGTVPSSHIHPQTSRAVNCRHNLPGWITGNLEWEHIYLPSLCVGRPSSRPRNICIIGHLEWENIRRPGIFVGRPSSRLSNWCITGHLEWDHTCRPGFCVGGRISPLCNIYLQMYHFLLGKFFDLTRYCPTASMECLGRSKGEDWWDLFCSLHRRIFNKIAIVTTLPRCTIPWYPDRL